MVQVIKRDGSKEPLNLDKFHRVVAFACEGLTGVSASEVELNSKIQFYNNIKSETIQETLIQSAAKLISVDNPNYQYVAARLLSYHLRKEVYGKYTPDKLYAHYKRVRDLGFYDKEFGDKYTPEEWAELNNYIKHDRDDDIAYVGMEQFRKKYLVRNRDTKEILETPQIAFMLMSMFFFQDETNKRLDYVKEFYDAASTFKISLPTPIMAGVRTDEKQFASCVLVESDDSLDSINATSGTIVKYVSKKAGMGIGFGRIRAELDPIRGGKAVHTGTVPFIKHMESAVLSCSQGSLRRGSGSLNLWGIHLDFEDQVVLKNNKGIPDQRARQLDYVVHLNKVIYERLIEGKNITLLSPAQHPELYQAYYTDIERFRELYEKAEKSRCRKKVISAAEYFEILIQERKDTGRIYIMNVDHCNDYGAYIKELAPIMMTNLCVEITETTKPLRHVFDPEGEIGLCTLSALNLGTIKNNAEMRRVSKILVRALDNLLSLQEYILPAAEICGKKRRSLGIGITNLAYYLAKNDISYETPDLNKVDEIAESYAYHVIEASIDLAEEKGPCELWKESIYSRGEMPILRAKKDALDLTDRPFSFDWQALAERAKDVGIRNYPILAGMPCETSAAVSNSTNGFEPIRSLASEKGSKDFIATQIAPESGKLKNKYDLKWDLKSPLGYLQIIAVFQKYMDQAISVNTFYNPTHYPNEEIPLQSVLQRDILLHYKWGGKTLYYFETFDGAGEIDIDEPCESCTV